MGWREYHDGEMMWDQTMRYEKGLYAQMQVYINGKHKQWTCPSSDTNRQTMESWWSKQHSQLFGVLNLH